MWIHADGVTPAQIGGVDDKTKPSVHGSIRVLAVGGASHNARYQKFVNRDWPTFDHARMNAAWPEAFHVDDAFFSTFDAANSGTLRDIGAYEYDAVAAVGLLACKVAPYGPLPSDFGTRAWKLKSNISFDGLTGSNQFDALGNRHPLTGNYVLFNLLMVADGSDGLTAQRRAQFENGTWVWEGGARQESGLIYNGGATQPPQDNFAPTDNSGAVLGLATGLGGAVLTALALLIYQRRRLGFKGSVRLLSHDDGAVAPKVAFITDIEGNWDYFERFVDRSEALNFPAGKPVFNDDGAAELLLAEGWRFIHGGDTCDKGGTVGGSIRITRTLCRLKRRYCLRPRPRRELIRRGDCARVSRVLRACAPCPQRAAITHRRAAARRPPAPLTRCLCAGTRIEWCCCWVIAM
eukprot:6741537-Prymnesium_polylepis.1